MKRVTGFLKEIVAGNMDQKALFYEAYSARLLRRLRARCRNWAGLDPEDLLQDAFVFCFRDDAAFLAKFLEHVPLEERTESRLECHLWDMASGLGAAAPLAAPWPWSPSVDREHVQPQLEGDELDELPNHDYPRP